MKKLTEFIDNYIKSKKLTEEGSTLPSYGTAEGRAYADAIAEADTAYARSLSDYGRTREDLREAGLGTSGYSEYLDGVAYAERARRQGEAERALAAAGVTDEDAQKSTSSAEDGVQKAFGKLLSQGIVDTEIAKSYLMIMGVEEEEADALAALSLQMQKNSSTLRSYILKQCVENRYSYNVAYRYALALGMSEAAAKDVAKESAAYRDAYFDDYYERN